MATEATPSAIDTGPRTAIASGPIFSPMRSRLQPDRGGQRERVEGVHLAHPYRLQAGPVGGERDLDRLLVGAVQPERDRHADAGAWAVELIGASISTGRSRT